MMNVSRNGEVVLSVSARTDVGMIRRGNEDCFLVADLSTGNSGLVPEVSRHRVGDGGTLLVVSDGMGGAVAGEIASDLSVKAVRERLERNGSVADVSERLRSAVEDANRTVWQYAQENRQLAGMGATVTAVLCHERTAYVAQVGDSRAYVVRAGRIKQLTKDQSLVQLLMDSGAIKPEQAGQVPNNVILQALGTRADVVVAMTSIELCGDDYVLLCSDGLSNKVSADEMRDAVVACGEDLSGACRRMIELANARGGEDNITVLVARFDGTALQSASERSSITGSMHHLTPSDLLQIGGSQFEHFYDPASDTPQPPPDVSSALGSLGVSVVPAPNSNPNSVTQVGFPALPPAAASVPDVVVPGEIAPEPSPGAAAPFAASQQQGHATPPPTSYATTNAAAVPAAAAPQQLKATSSSMGMRLLVALAFAFVVFAILAVVVFAVYYFVIMPRLDG